jgi:hypothetical protein
MGTRTCNIWWRASICYRGANPTQNWCIEYSVTDDITTWLIVSLSFHNILGGGEKWYFCQNFRQNSFCTKSTSPTSELWIPVPDCTRQGTITFHDVPWLKKHKYNTGMYSIRELLVEVTNENHQISLEYSVHLLYSTEFGTSTARTRSRWYNYDNFCTVCTRTVGQVRYLCSAISVL